MNDFWKWSLQEPVSWSSDNLFNKNVQGGNVQLDENDLTVFDFPNLDSISKQLNVGSSPEVIRLLCLIALAKSSLISII